MTEKSSERRAPTFYVEQIKRQKRCFINTKMCPLKEFYLKIENKMSSYTTFYLCVISFYKKTRSLIALFTAPMIYYKV